MSRQTEDDRMGFLVVLILVVTGVYYVWKYLANYQPPQPAHRLAVKIETEPSAKPLSPLLEQYLREMRGPN